MQPAATTGSQARWSTYFTKQHCLSLFERINIHKITTSNRGLIGIGIVQKPPNAYLSLLLQYLLFYILPQVLVSRSFESGGGGVRDVIDLRTGE